MTWKVPGQNYERRYDYTYDGMNRLVEGAYSHLRVFTPLPGIISSTGEEILTMGESSPLSLIPVIDTPGDLVGPISINAADRYTERISYDKNSNITSLERYGMNNQHNYGLIDSLVITRNGNQLKAIEDYAEKHLTYTGASDFYDGYTYTTEYGYNANGALDYDINRDIDMIEYDYLGNSRYIYYFSHDQIEYIYAADGTKLRTIHRPAGSTALTDSIDYVGNLILKNGQPSMYLFDGGYATFNTNGAVDGWHYYIQDYMGNNRMVVNKNGTVEQVTHYYPYGGVIGDISTNESLQKYKFEGKELDRNFGLDNYDIHARNYFAMAPTWDRIDSKAEDYYHLSPYSYCAGNPVNLGDYDGESTRVIRTDSTHYQVVGGDINDGDYNIYVCVDTGEEGDDRYANTGVSIGVTETLTSFYTDSGEWTGTIDVQDNSGIDYLSNICDNTPSLRNYIKNARNNHLYDFKVTNGTNEKRQDELNHYRGMPLGYNENGARIYASARDVGNNAAGIVARKKGLSWNLARFGFDLYQSYKTLRYHLVRGPHGVTGYHTFRWTPEGMTTQNAQLYGFIHYKK